MSRRSSISWHENNGSSNNYPSTYDKFTYNNEGNKIFSLLEQINAVTRSIQSDTEEVVRGINRLSNKYGSCRDYDEYVKDMKDILILRNNDLVDTNKSIIKNMDESISSLTDKDTKLINDLEILNKMMNR